MVLHSGPVLTCAKIENCSKMLGKLQLNSYFWSKQRSRSNYYFQIIKVFLLLLHACSTSCSISTSNEIQMFSTFPPILRGFTPAATHQHFVTASLLLLPFTMDSPIESPTETPVPKGKKSSRTKELPGPIASLGPEQLKLFQFRVMGMDGEEILARILGFHW